MSNKTGERNHTVCRSLLRAGLQLKSHVQTLLGEQGLRRRLNVEGNPNPQAQAERAQAGAGRAALRAGPKPTAAPLNPARESPQRPEASALPCPEGCLSPATPTFLHVPGAPSCTGRLTSWRTAGRGGLTRTAPHGGGPGAASLVTASPWQRPPEARPALALLRFREREKKRRVCCHPPAGARHGRSRPFGAEPNSGTAPRAAGEGSSRPARPGGSSASRAAATARGAL